MGFHTGRNIRSSYCLNMARQTELMCSNAKAFIGDNTSVN